MDFSEAEKKEAKSFGDFFINQIENHLNCLKYYFSEDVILDWFGQTVKGEKNVCAFLKKNVSSVNHILLEAVPAKKIGFRDTHVIRIPKESKSIPLGLMSPPRIINQRTQAKTPKKQSCPSTSTNRIRSDDKFIEHGQGDGLHNPSASPESLVSPTKKFKSSGDFVESDLETVEGECDTNCKIKYVTLEGAVEFHRPSMKKLQRETKWRRPCKLSMAYSNTANCDYMIYLIIYEGNVKCRRNLIKDFEAEETDN